MTNDSPYLIGGASVNTVDANITGALIRTFGELSVNSSRIANGLRALGVKRGDRILVMLGNIVSLWEVMLAAMKLGAVAIPASTLRRRTT